MSLEEELEDAESPHDDLRFRVQSLEHWLTHAVHVVTTLKSVNDTSLSDWRGVIGEEIDKRKEEQEEREEQVADMLERFDGILQERDKSLGETKSELQAEVEALNAELRQLMVGLNMSRARLIRKSPNPRAVITTACPSCGEAFVYKQRQKPSSWKSVNCKSCGKKYVSRYSETGGFYLNERTPTVERISCPWCKADITAQLDPMPNAIVRGRCISCNGGFRINRLNDGSTGVTRSIPPEADTIASKMLSEDVLASIKAALPPQPWPHGIHKEVAKQLALSPAVVLQGINALVKKREFQVQFSGQLMGFVPAEIAIPNPPEGDSGAPLSD